MSIILFLLSLFGLTVVPTTEAARQATVATVESELDTPSPVVVSSTCPSEPSYARMTSKILEGRARLQPILASQGSDFKAFEKEWDSFVAHLPQHIQFVLLPPMRVTLGASDIQKGEAFPDVIIANRLVDKVGTLAEHSIPIVYWDFEAASPSGYDWNSGLFMRSMMETVTAQIAQGSSDEKNFLEWLTFIHE